MKRLNLLKTELNKRNILITGASGNLGKEFFYYLEILGANLIICDIKKINVPKLKKKHIYFNLDVSKKNQWLTLRKKLTKKKIFVDTLINCAGYTNHSEKKNFSNNIFKINPENILKVFEVNTFGTIYGCQVFGEEMLKKNRGCIVNIASMYAIRSPKHYIYKGTGIKSPLTYAASKSSVVSITKYLGTLWGKYGVRVNSISPGGIRDKTHQKKWLNRYANNNPLNRMAYNYEMINALLYLISDTSSYTNASNLIVDGGWTSW